MTSDLVSNADARLWFLDHHGLSAPPGRSLRRADLATVIDDLGFVQVDSIRTVEQAHHHILFSRAHSYRHAWLRHHLEKTRGVFENWTHDAAIIPTRYFGYWRPKFRQTHDRLMANAWWRLRLGDDFARLQAEILARVRDRGPVMAREISDTETPATPGGAWWGWRPSKTVLEFMWRTGTLAVTGRQGFQKIYDLTENVIPAPFRDQDPSHDAFVDWACASAIARLGFATPREIARFWDLVTIAEATAWCAGPGRDRLRPVAVEMADGGRRKMVARADLLTRRNAPPAPPGRLRLLSPFDPLLRDRGRAARLFGFDYRFEAFVPAARRQYGYYVLPILEGARLIGRIDMKAERDQNRLRVKGLWLEARLSWTPTRRRRLENELARWGRFLNLSDLSGLKF